MERQKTHRTSREDGKAGERKTLVCSSEQEHGPRICAGQHNFGRLEELNADTGHCIDVRSRLRYRKNPANEVHAVENKQLPKDHANIQKSRNCRGAGSRKL
eukprot:6212960-Pleurochrysis_carterae.AAC.1